MTTRERNQSLGEIAVEPTFRSIDGVSVRYVESEPRNSDALLLSPWPESILCYEPVWSRLADMTHLVAIDLPGFGRSERKDSYRRQRSRPVKRPDPLVAAPVCCHPRTLAAIVCRFRSNSSQLT